MDTKERQNDELDTLLISFKNANDEKKKRMLHLKIVEEAMALVKKIANTIALQSGISNEDLIQVGSLGLIKAIEFYRLDMNTKFRTYATYFIKGEIKHYLRDKASIIKAPRELQELLFKINTARKKLSESGLEPNPEKIAEYLDLPVAKINEVIEIEKFEQPKTQLKRKLNFREQQMNVPVFNADYEKYEWLMKYGCTNPEQRKWLEKYLNSDEYNNLYGA